MTWKDGIKKESIEEREVKAVIDLIKKAEKGILHLAEGISDDMIRFDKKTKPAFQHVRKAKELIEDIYDEL